MADFKVYVSDLHIDRDWTFSPGQYFKMDWDQLNTEYPDPACYLVALDEKQLNLLHHLVSIFPKYYRNWGYSNDTLDEAAWDDIQAWVSELELCLMSGCKVSDLLAGVDRLTAAVAGETITIDVDGVPTAFDYTETGISPRLAALSNLAGIYSNTNNLSHLAGIDSDTDALSNLGNLASLDALADINLDLDALANLGQLPAMLTQLANLALDTDALAALSNLSQLANINTNLENLQRLVDINTALGQLTALGNLTGINADLDALSNLGNLSNLLTIAGSLGDLNTEATTLTGLAANIAAELGDLNVDLDYLNQLETVAVKLAELSQRFRTHNAFYPDQDISDVLAATLYGKYVGIPIPGDGVGITDMLDEVKAEIVTLHNRFRQDDNIIGELNITETMEHLLRKTGIFDPEANPNVADIMDYVFRMGGEESWAGVIKRLWRDTMIKMGLTGGEIEEDKTTITQALLMIAAHNKDLNKIAQAIKDSETQININNTANCNGSNGALPTNGNNGQIVLTDEGVNVQIDQPAQSPLLGPG